MRNSVHQFLLTCMLILATGCAPTAAAPQPAPGPGTPAAPAPGAPGQPTPTPLPAQEVTVTIRDTAIQSSLDTFHAGQPYTFVVTNAGSRPHCFTIAQPVMVTGNLAGSQDTALVDISQTKLPPGATVRADYTFPDSTINLGLEFACFTRRDYYSNVRMWITVTK